MKKMTVCFVGIGSIAKRHIRNLDEICRNSGIVCEIDICRSGNGAQLEHDIIEKIRNKYTCIEEVPGGYDAVFITNPTRYHVQTLQQFCNKADNFFIEKPIADLQDMEALDKLKLPQNKLYYVACPMRYTKVIQYIKSNIDPKRVYSVRCICSSYLPEWRAGVDYREVYSAHKDMGGGVSIDLIHEWDYLKYLFGMPQSIEKCIAQISDLEIDSDDIAVYIAQYPDKILELHLDYFGRKTIREICLFMPDDTVVCDLTENQIRYLKSGRVIDFCEERDDYQKRELEHFCQMIDGTCRNSNTIEDAYETMKLTQGGTR